MNNSIVWVDIPVTEVDRAIAFYSAVLGTPVTKQGGPGFVFGLLPHVPGGVGGCLYFPEGDNAPSRVGPLVYLNVAGRLMPAIEAVLANGGRVLQAIQPIGAHGFRAIVVDCEGNRIALHSPTA
jgi:predicted enzyme related to lactoylglutathione lyase